MARRLALTLTLSNLCLPLIVFLIVLYCFSFFMLYGFHTVRRYKDLDNNAEISGILKYQ